MKLIHPDGGEVDCHPSQIENMKNFGWVEPAKDVETETKEVTENGES